MLDSQLHVLYPKSPIDQALAVVGESIYEGLGLSATHFSYVLLCEQDVVNPIHGELDEELEVLDVFLFPLSNVVSFIISEPSRPFGAFLDIGVLDIGANA